jgi:hypothetical protein
MKGNHYEIPAMSVSLETEKNCCARPEGDRKKDSACPNSRLKSLVKCFARTMTIAVACFSTDRISLEGELRPSCHAD